MKPAFVWDLDGTLIDSYPAILRSLEKTYQHQGWSFEKEELKDYILTYSVEQLIEEQAALHQLDASAIKAVYSQDLKTRDAEMVLFPDSRAVLDWTQEVGIPNFIYTHKGENTQKVLEELGIAHYFVETLHSQSGFARKPDPEAMDYLLETHGLDGAQTYYIGDRKLDLDFALNSGVQSISLTQASSAHNHYITRLEDIPNLSPFADL